MQIFFLTLILTQFLHAEKFVDAIYKFAYTDTLLAFTSSNIHFRCNVAGIKTVTNVLNNPQTNSNCILELVNFQKAVPMQKHSPDMILHNYITYHVEPIAKTSCKVMLNAGRSYAQKLLELGYAKVDEKQKLNLIYMQALKRSQEFAKKEEAGIWKKKKWQQCMK